ncbi:hypothetical protein TNCV_2414051 [Trichonephila clavipes]|nr:hypothetical protein TNCV_2414051 [Trichonephila clavipes]
MPAQIRFVPVYTTKRHFAGSKCRPIFRTLFQLGTLGVKSGVFSNSPMMHCARDSFIQDGCCFGLLTLDNRGNNPHKLLRRLKRIGYNCPGFRSLQVPISNKNYIQFSQSSASAISPSISFHSDLDNMVITVLLEKPTEGNWTAKDIADHVNDDHFVGSGTPNDLISDSGPLTKNGWPSLCPE